MSTIHIQGSATVGTSVSDLNNYAACVHLANGVVLCLTEAGLGELVDRLGYAQHRIRTEREQRTTNSAGGRLPGNELLEFGGQSRQG